MIKKCKVIARNTIHMVVIYDGIEVQMPTDFTSDTEVYIRKVGNGFVLSSENEFTKFNKKKQKKTSGAELAKADNATDKIFDNE